MCGDRRIQTAAHAEDGPSGASGPHPFADELDDRAFHFGWIDPEGIVDRSNQPP
jgi:hypothetical protein